MLCSSKASSHLNLAWPIRCVQCGVTQSSPSLWDPKDWSLPDSPVHGDSPGKNPGLGFHALPHGIFPTRDGTQVSCNAGGFFTI